MRMIDQTKGQILLLVYALVHVKEKGRKIREKKSHTTMTFYNRNQNKQKNNFDKHLKLRLQFLK